MIDKTGEFELELESILGITLDHQILRDIHPREENNTERGFH
jgi:hypothetical protein